MNEDRILTSLRHAPSGQPSSTSSAELEKLRKKAWQDQEVVVTAVAEIDDADLRTRIVKWATKKFGKSKGTTR